jgi:hygromycin-B 4-O-kinase
MAGMVDEAQANAFLAWRFGGAAGRVTPVGEGEWSRAYFFDHAGAPYVIRFSALEEDFAKDRLAAGWAGPGLPVPRMVEMGEVGDVGAAGGSRGGYYAITERAPGRYLDVLDGAQLQEVLPSLFGTLDAAREVDLAGTTGYGGWDGSGKAPHGTWREALLAPHGDRLLGWRERLDASPLGAGLFEECAARLEALVAACPEGRHLIHSDLLHYNVLVSGGRISAVLDWGCGLFGDFLYDVAWLVFFRPWYPAWSGIDFVHAAARHYAAGGLDVPDLEARLRCYGVHIGLGGLSWNAYKENWAELERTAQRTLALAQGGTL